MQEHDPGLLVAVSQGSVHVTPGLAIGLCRALVEELLAPRHAYVELRSAAFQVESQGNQGQPLLLHRLSQLIDLAPMHQQLAGPIRGMVGAVAVAVRRDG